MKNRNLHAGKPAPAESSATYIDAEKNFGARNYDPLPVVVSHGEGAWLWDIHGRRFLDMMSAYSAVSHGHAHPRIVTALVAQAQQLGVTSRAFHNDKLPLFLKRLTEVTGLARALPANGGAEAVETALKAVRKWGYKVKRIPDGQAEVIVCAGNFHGRSITIVGFSSETQYRDGFGPFAPGFKAIPFGDAAALEAVITPNTAAFLVEPVQGEAGMIVPPAGYLAECARICRKHRVLMICDEIQTGMGRTGRLWCYEHSGVEPDIMTLARALANGVPIGATLVREDVASVLGAGSHGSTFGGTPFVASVALATFSTIVEDKLPERAARMGRYLMDGLRAIAGRRPVVREVRGRGLLIGATLTRPVGPVVDACREAGLLVLSAGEQVLRLAPPLIVEERDCDRGLAIIDEALGKRA